MRPTWLKWIELNNRDQLTWIRQYLAEKGYHEVALANGHSPDGDALIEAMARHEQDSAFRYWANKMRAAWRQKQYRARNGQQVTFQLPKSVQMDLARLAKAKGRSKVETLRQVISDAADQQEREKKQIKDLKDKRKQDEALYRRFSDSMLDALAEELHQRCGLEALIGECDDESLVGEHLVAYQDLVEKRVTELEAAHQDLNLARPGGSSLRRRMQARAERCGTARPTDDTQ